MNTQPAELEAIKRDIDFVVIAEQHGYRLRGDKSTRKDKILEGPDGSKIVVSRSANGHWIYFSAIDQKDKGSVIDFVQKRTNCNLGEARKRLRPYLTGCQSTPQVAPADDKDFLAIWRSLQPVNSQYLSSRGITQATQSDPLFAGRLGIDQRGNACFPLITKDGLKGVARYNKGWKGIDEGSTRGIWSSNLLPFPFPVAQVQVVITESPLDSLSFQQIQRGGRYYHIATCGNLSNPQIEIIRYCIRVTGVKVVLSAFDDDSAGDRYHADLVGAGIDSERIVPPRGKDWNEFLRFNFNPVSNINTQ